MGIEQLEQRPDVAKLSEAVTQVKAEIGKVIVGQEAMIELLIAAILADGHVLIEGVPGCSKNTNCKTVGPLYRCSFQPDTIYSRSYAE
jgi:MoxR-like ATPase